jgi:serine/threonine protein kinase
VLSATALDGRSVYFEVTRKLASGGEGVVYQAIADDGQVAVVKGPLLVGTRDLSLEREARHLAAVNPHPNVVQLLGTLKDPRGHSLVFLERAFDIPLRALNRDTVKPRLAERQAKAPRPVPGLVNRARLIAPPVSVALELAYDLACGIEHVHEKGFVHGDVKPLNVMVALSWPEAEIPDRVYFERIAKGRWRGLLIDMGGARTAKELDALARGLPVVKPPKMTAAYAPPEVLPGLVDAAGKERSHFTQAMDVYAFGLTLYQLVSGFLPYAHLPKPPPDNDLSHLARAKREERDGAHRPISRAALDAIDWSDCSLEAMTKGSDREAFLEELWKILAQTTNAEPSQRGKMRDVKALLAKLLGIEYLTIDQARSLRDAGDDAERTVRTWTQKRLRLDSFASRLAEAARDGTTEKVDPKSRKIQRGASDFWDMQGMGGGR